MYANTAYGWFYHKLIKSENIRTASKYKFMFLSTWWSKKENCINILSSRQPFSWLKVIHHSWFSDCIGIFMTREKSKREKKGLKFSIRWKPLAQIEPPVFFFLYVHIFAVFSGTVRGILVDKLFICIVWINLLKRIKIDFINSEWTKFGYN